MDEFTKTISSLGWWLGVVLVGILLNIISAYIKPLLDKCFSSISTWYRTRSEQARDKRAELIARLRADVKEQTLLAETENRHRLRGLLYALATVFNLILYLSMKMSFVLASIKGWEPHGTWAQWLFFWTSMLISFFCVAEISNANNCESLLNEARKASTENEMP